MVNRIPRITKRSVDAIKPDGSDTVYWDGELTGFGLRVRSSGRKVYVVQTRVDGKLRWFTIGACGVVSTDEARAKALEILALAKKGIDPRDAEARRETEPTVVELGRRFLEEYVPDHCKPSTQQEYRRSVGLFIDPVIGEMRVSEVQRKDIAALHHGLRDKPYQANRTLGVLSKMFNMSEIWGWRQDGSNPCRHVKRYKEHQRERFLSEEETARLGEVLREAEDEMPSAVAAFRLLLLTGCRMSEIRGPEMGVCEGGLHRASRREDRRASGAVGAGGPRGAVSHSPRERQSVGDRRQAPRLAPNRPAAALAAHPQAGGP